MEKPDPSLVKHKEYPVSNVFGQSAPKTPEKVVIDVGDDETGDSAECGKTSQTIIDHDGKTTETTVLMEQSTTTQSPEAKLMNPDPSPNQFAIEDHQKNTAKNPYKESTNLVPIMVRRIQSYEILPRPFRTTNQFLCLAYVSVLFCFCCGAAATHWAWQAKLQRNKGLYVVAKRSANYALYCIVAAVVSGIIILVALLSIFL